jgi:hypothetical protein
MAFTGEAESSGVAVPDQAILSYVRPWLSRKSEKRAGRNATSIHRYGVGYYPK